MENKNTNKPLTIKERIMCETPDFFKKLRNIGLTIGAVGGVLVSAPVALPALVVTIGGYLITAGLVIGAVSQVTVKQGE